jgi:hypothetical protein
MKNSWFISIFVLLFAGCVSVKPAKLTRDPSQITRNNVIHQPLQVIPFSSRFLLFKASLDIKKHHLTGLLVIKRMDSLIDAGNPGRGIRPVYRIVFANEIGMTFFDLELTCDSLKVISCFESLNKKALMKIFRTDFLLLTGMDTMTEKRFYTQSPTNNLVVFGKAGKLKSWQTFSPSGDTLIKTSGKSTIADPVIISYLKYEKGFPTRITVENPFISMKLTMRLLNRKP